MDEQPKRILILTADAGFGHRSAAKAAAEALAELYGESCLPRQRLAELGQRLEIEAQKLVRKNLE